MKCSLFKPFQIDVNLVDISMDDRMIKKLNICLSLLLAVLFYLHVRREIPYQLLQLEHSQLFLGDMEHLLRSLHEIGGLAEWIGMGCIQFFALPHIGFLVFVLPAWLLFVWVSFILLRLGTSPVVATPLAAWTGIVQLALLFDYDYFWWGALALCLAVGYLFLLSFLRPTHWQAVLFVSGVPMVLWLLGPVVWVYAIGGIIVLFRKRNWISTALIPGILCVGIVFLCCHWGIISTLSDAVSPDFYTDALVKDAHWHLYAGWFVVLLALLAGRLLSRMVWKRNLVRLSVCLLGWAIPLAAFFQYGSTYRHSVNNDLWQLNHYAYEEDWDGLLDVLSDRPMNNYLYMNYANMALLQKGELGEKVFYYQPWGVNSLLLENTNSGFARMLMSDVYYAIGCIAESQRQAFEAQVVLPKSMGIQPMKRLVKTNLIFGHYPVAEKYLDLIGKSTLHKDWAERYRTFLYDDEAVEADPELGEKRRSLPKENQFVGFTGAQAGLMNVLKPDTENEKALLYLGLSFLLGKDLEAYRNFLERYGDSPFMEKLPSVLQQGIIVLLERQPEQWKHYRLSSQVMDMYAAFRGLYMQNARNPNLKNIMQRSFGHTLWYYLIFV